MKVEVELVRTVRVRMTMDVDKKSDVRRDAAANPDVMLDWIREGQIDSDLIRVAKVTEVSS